MTDKKDSIWKTLSVTSISCVVLMTGFWLVEVQGYVDQEQVSNMIQRESPYTVDRELVRATLNDVRINIKNNTEVLNRLNIEIARFRTQIDEMNYNGN